MTSPLLNTIAPLSKYAHDHKLTTQNTNAPGKSRDIQETFTRLEHTLMRLQDLSPEEREIFDVLTSVVALEVMRFTPGEIDSRLHLKKPKTSAWYSQKFPALYQLARSYYQERAYQAMQFNQLQFHEILGAASVLSVGFLAQIVLGGGPVLGIPGADTGNALLQPSNFTAIPKKDCDLATRVKAAESVLKFVNLFRKIADASPADGTDMQKVTGLPEEFTDRVKRAESKARTMRLKKKGARDEQDAEG